MLVLGLGVSGRSAARFCAQRGARVVAADERPAAADRALETLPIRRRASRSARPSPTRRLRPGGAEPGRARASATAEARARAWGDIELRLPRARGPDRRRHRHQRQVDHDAAGRGDAARRRAARPRGRQPRRPALSLVGEALDVAVLEVSSFQLETVESFRPARGGGAQRHAGPPRPARELRGATSRPRRASLAQPAAAGYGGAQLRRSRRAGPRRAHARARAALSTPGPVSRTAPSATPAAPCSRSPAARERYSLDGLRLAGVHNLENVVAALAAVTSPRGAGRRALRARSPASEGCRIAARSWRARAA